MEKRLGSYVKRSRESLMETLKLLKEPAPSSLDAVPWADVLAVTDALQKQANSTGMLFCGKPTRVEQREITRTYINLLQNFLCKCHGTTVGAGPTFLFVFRKLVKNVFDTSLELLEACAKLEEQEARQPARQQALPPLSGLVWNACDALKKAPSDNRTAIGRAIVKVGVSVKDVLRELSEIVDSEPNREEEGEEEEEEQEAAAAAASESDNDDNVLDMSVCHCSEAEKNVIRKSRDYIDAVFGVLKQAIFVVNKAERDSSVEKLEAVLALTKIIGDDAEELGALAMPSQEIEQIKKRAWEIDDAIKLLVCTLGDLASEGSAGLPALVSEYDRATGCLRLLEELVAQV